MPFRPKKPCNKPGCPSLVNGPYCEKHTVLVKKKNWKRIDRGRASSTKRGYDYKWKKARDAYLVLHPLCVQCEEAGLTVAAGVVDHIIPHKQDMNLFWDTNNWQALCTTCHNRKSASEGAFSNR